MKTGINADCFDITDAEECVERLADNGFLSTFLLAEEEKLASVAAAAKRKGVTIETLHAPFSDDGECYINDMWFSTDKSEKMLKRLIAAAEKCSEYSIPYLVTHLSSGDSAPKVCAEGWDNFYKLIKRAKELGVTVAFENLRKLGNLACAMEYFSSARFCFDVGHQNCYTKETPMLSLFADRLVALHIHDNLQRHGEDLHRIPFDGKIDFAELISDLKKYGFKGTLMLEVFKKNWKEKECDSPYYKMSCEQYVKRAQIAANKLKALYGE